MRQDILDFLYQPFEVHTKPGKGQFKFVESRDVIDRMNRAFMGNWSSEVLDFKIIEDNIVIWARVSIIDPETKTEFKQDGYGSSPIQRFTFGDNQGKPVDIGNSFKSALSKAIKAACARWGAGLFIEEGETSDGMGFMPQVPQNFSNEIPTPETLSESKLIKDNIPSIPGMSMPSIPSTPIKLAAPESSPVFKEELQKPLNEGFSFPSVPLPQKNDDINKKNDGISIPSFPQNNIQEEYSNPMPTIPSPDNIETQKIYTDENLPPTSTQKAALEGMLTFRKFDYQTLASEAFEAHGWSKDMVPPVEDLTKEQATVIIGYGNKFTRK